VSAQSSLLDDSHGLVEDAALPVLTNCSVPGEAGLDGGGTSVLLPPPRLDPARHTTDPLDLPTALDYEQAWQRLTSRPIPQDELPSLIKTIFSDKRGTDMVTRLSGDNAPAFIDTVDGVRHRTCYFQGVGWLTPLSTLCTLPVRHWISLTSHRVSEITA